MLLKEEIERCYSLNAESDRLVDSLLNIIKNINWHPDLSFTSLRQTRERAENDVNIICESRYEINLFKDVGNYIVEINNTDSHNFFYISNLTCTEEDVFFICFQNRELQVIFHVEHEDRSKVHEVEVLAGGNYPIVTFR